MLKIVEIKDRTLQLAADLTNLWQDAVMKTHDFLIAYEVLEIGKSIPHFINKAEHLLLAKSNFDQIAGFMAINEKKADMLFVAAKEQGKGTGTSLMKYAIKKYGINEVTVNEQNKMAKKFYEKMGFAEYARTDYDEEGRPFPLLYMKR